MSNNKFFLILLFFPLLLAFLLGWVIYWKFFGKKQIQQQKQKKEWVKKTLAHIKNFSPARLKNRRWQNISKKKGKKPIKHTKNKQK
ncbi:hypothetical protein [endosymbiont GvMRE of Glomus versiforme]|uniref:hypothetical protein n=1 Tax=endosymbiont GvMRE of Glomus versiforme TaxID=2039283 RepID=UPI000EE25749|nr:hypothetical protein [endosymbiont GvMRE of Glomus versiforme]RHZ35888.1 hypothetical protein GvMRE_Ic4g53 [endosymbiont GvMRE of Glomus versiforme]